MSLSEQNLPSTELSSWLEHALRRLFKEKPTSVNPISGDASFRRYYRVTTEANTYVAVKAPSDRVNNQAFIKMAELLAKYDVAVPRVLAFDLEAGFMLLNDLGDRLLLPALDANRADKLYRQAIADLLKFQQIPAAEYSFLPPYDQKFLNFEMSLFNDWFVTRHLGLGLDQTANKTLTGTFAKLTESAIEQPTTLVHRDYHSRNLMLVAENSTTEESFDDNASLAVIDFQDALIGPISYDLVSLLKDCYIHWPPHQVEKWCREYWKAATDKNLLSIDFAQFMRWFDWMGMQRHIKVLGIFCRLNYRDNKPAYLNDLPLTMTYLHETAKKYAEFSDFCLLLENQIIPAMNKFRPE